MILIFAGVLIWAHFVMIEAGRLDQTFDGTKYAYIWVVNGLLFCSLWDILLFPFCRKGVAKFICDRIRKKVGGISKSRQGSDDEL